MSASFSAPTRIVASLGAVDGLDAELGRLGAERVAVVADAGLLELGLVDDVVARGGIASRVVATIGAEVDPPPRSVEAGARAAVAAGATAVLGIGGGSGLGAAKAIALLLTQDVPITSLEGVGVAQHPPAPMIAVPTTAGSGSEVSNALVLHEPGRVREIVIRGAGYQPDVAVLDATLLRGLPRTPLLYAALDALSHAMEALWARGASMFTDACALHAADAIIRMLPRAADGAADGANRAGDNDQTLQGLLEASSLANLACGNSGLALIHALSSSPAVSLAHGLQNGVLLPSVARLNHPVMSDPARALAARIEPLYDRLCFTARFEAGTADPDAMIAASTDHVFRRNNRLDTTDDDLRALLGAVGADRPIAVATDAV